MTHNSFDAADAVAAANGSSREEVLWTWERMKTLRASGIDREEAEDIISREASFRPWVMK